MRITTQMLNASYTKAGLPIPRTSLLDYLNNDASDDTLLSALSKSGKAGSLLNGKNYEKLQKEAEALEKQAGVFSAEGRDSIFEKLKEGGDKAELTDEVEALVKSYNSTIDALQKTSGTMNLYYYQMLSEAAAGNKEALSSIGISVAKDGKLTLDKEKLEAADTETVEKVLGSSGSFIHKAEFLAGRISDNAKANAESISTQYDASGSAYTELLRSYDVRR